MEEYMKRFVRTDLALELKDDIDDCDLSDGVSIYTS